MKENDKNLSKEEVKKTQDKIILITRITGVVLFLIGISIVFITAIIKGKQEVIEEDFLVYESSSTTYSLDNEEENILDKDYTLINSIDEYQNFLLEIDNWSNELITNFETQINSNEYMDEIAALAELENYKTSNQKRIDSIKKTLEEAKISEESLKDNTYIIVEDVTMMSVLQSSNIVDICKDGNKLTIYIQKEVIGVVGGGEVAFYVIKVEKEILKDSKIIVNITENNNSEPGVAYKPIIYIYPEKEMNVNVTLGYPNNITVSYPKYKNNWNVLAKQDGTLIDNKTGRELYSLYYESINKNEFKIEEEGFVIKGEDTISFLEEKLEILGLNSKEQEEFIIY